MVRHAEQTTGVVVLDTLAPLVVDEVELDVVDANIVLMLVVKGTRVAVVVAAVVDVFETVLVDVFVLVRSTVVVLVVVSGRLDRVPVEDVVFVVSSNSFVPLVVDVLRLVVGARLLDALDVVEVLEVIETLVVVVIFVVLEVLVVVPLETRELVVLGCMTDVVEAVGVWVRLGLGAVVALGERVVDGIRIVLLVEGRLPVVVVLVVAFGDVGVLVRVDVLRVTTPNAQSGSGPSKAPDDEHTRVVGVPIQPVAQRTVHVPVVATPSQSCTYCTP